ncbi:MAG: hypothetical protein ABIF08_01670 [Nanoarchaeota archaeon]
MSTKEKFLKIYYNLPLTIRSEVITVFEKEPMTWNAVYIEVRNNTEKAEKILKKLEELEII